MLEASASFLDWMGGAPGGAARVGRIPPFRDRQEPARQPEAYVAQP